VEERLLLRSRRDSRGPLEGVVTRSECSGTLAAYSSSLACTKREVRKPSRKGAETKTHLELSHSSVLLRSLALESLDFRLGLMKLCLNLVERGSMRVEVEKDRVPSCCDLLVLALDLNELLTDCLELRL
jgi:hypothetical protein